MITNFRAGDSKSIFKFVQQKEEYRNSQRYPENPDHHDDDRVSFDLPSETFGAQKVVSVDHVINFKRLVKRPVPTRRTHDAGRQSNAEVLS